MTRKFVDCRETPSESNCSLAIYGEEDEVVLAAAHHVQTVHGHSGDGVEDLVRSLLKDAPANA